MSAPAKGNASSAARRRTAEKMHSAAIHLLRTLRREDDRLGLSPARLSALSVIVFAGPIHLGALADAEGVAAPTMVRIVDALEKDTLARRLRDPEDGRAVLVSATRKGKKLLGKGRAARVQRFVEMLSGLSAEELRLLDRSSSLLEATSKTRRT